MTRASIVVLLLVLAGCQRSPAAHDDAATPSDGGQAGDRAAPLASHDVLFVGNSYVYVNDVPGHYRAIASALWSEVRVEAVATGGYELAQHAEDARTDGTALAGWLRPDALESRKLDAVVLQEQSQIGGFPTRYRADSVAAASELAALAGARGARVVLYLTWGHQHGDPTNSLLGYGTYTGMQDRLDEGYLGLAALLREQGVNVLVAPVGGGFRTTFDDVVRAGGDPGAEGSDFAALYQPDGSHPSLRGAYLASCIIAGTITGADVRGFVDEPTLGPEPSRRLRDVCARTLANPRWHVATVHRADGVLRGDHEEGAFFGAAVATSADGTRVMVGAAARGLPAGAASARVFARTGAGWAEEALWQGGVGFGSSVALSGDGAHALVGPPPGVRSRSGTSWSAAAPLFPGPGVGNTKLALSADGERAIVSEASGWPAMVSVRVFVLAGSAWTEEATLQSFSTFTAGTPAVALDQQGQRAMVGAFGASPPQIFVRAGVGWAAEATLSASGASVALSADGTRALVNGPPGHLALGCANCPACTLFVRTGAGWAEEAVLRAPAYALLVSGVALSADGRRALVGVPLDTPAATGLTSGSVLVYDLHDGGFRPQLLLVPRLSLEGLAVDHFGDALAISPDGTRVVVGAPAAESADGLLYVGAAHTFTLPKTD